MSIPYDAAYKEMFSLREMVEHLAVAFLPGDWHAAVQWDTLQLAPTEHVGPQFQQRENDLVWRVQRRDGSGLYIYLMLEFQSRVDRAMAVRVNTYTALLIEQHWQRRTAGRERIRRAGEPGRRAVPDGAGGERRAARGGHELDAQGAGGGGQFGRGRGLAGVV